MKTVAKNWKLIALGVILTGSMSFSVAFGGKGTLYGNSSGDRFCCGSGTNDCNAASCKSDDV